MDWDSHGYRVAHAHNILLQGETTEANTAGYHGATGGQYALAAVLVGGMNVAFADVVVGVSAKSNATTVTADEISQIYLGSPRP